MKKTLLLTSMALFSVPLLHSQDMVYEGIAYNLLNDEELEVTALPDNEKYSGEIHIPFAFTIGDTDEPIFFSNENFDAESGNADSPKTYYVVKVGDSAFKDCTGLTKLELPFSLREIGKEAVAGCTALTAVTMPENLDKIGDSAFENSHFGSLSITRGLEEMGNRVFYGVVADDIILTGCSLTAFGEETFTNSTIKKILLPAGLKSIPANTFSGCAELNYVEFDDALEVIGENAFSGCYSLRAISLPENIGSLADNAFTGVEINSVSFNGDVTKGYGIESICNGNLPALVVFPAGYENAYREWCPELFTEKVSIRVCGDYGPYLQRWIYPGMINDDNLLDVLPYGVAVSYGEDTVILTDKGEDVSVCLPKVYGGGYEILLNGHAVASVTINSDLDSFFGHYSLLAFVGDSNLVTLRNVEEDCELEVKDNGTVSVCTPTGSKDGIRYDAESKTVTCSNELIAIYDISGKRVAQGISSASTMDLKPGIYLIHTTTATKKIIVR